MVLNRFIERSEGMWNKDMSDQLKYFESLAQSMESRSTSRKSLTAFDVSFEYVLSAAARRQKWIDQSQSVNLFLGTQDLKNCLTCIKQRARANHYYLRTLGASNIEKATVDLKKAKPCRWTIG